MKSKLIYICIAIILLGGLFYAGWQRNESTLAEKRKQALEQENSKVPKIDLSIAVQKFEESIKKDYKAVAYAKLGDESNKKDISIGRYKIAIDNSEKNTFSIFKDNKLVSTYDSLDPIARIGSLKLNDTDYFLLQSFSGGAHCCFNWQAITHENDVLVLGKRIDLLHTGEQVDKYYFEKAGQLYFLMYDSSFANFHTSFSDSFFFPVFYKIDAKSANFVPVNNEFEKYYKQLAIDMNEEIEKIKTNFASKIDFNLPFTASTNEIFPSLTHELVIHVLANSDIETAKNEFVDDCNFFFKGGMINGEAADSVANEVIEKVSLLNIAK